MLNAALRATQEPLLPHTLMIGKCSLCEHHTTILAAPPTRFGLCCVECYQTLLDDQNMNSAPAIMTHDMPTHPHPHGRTPTRTEKTQKRPRTDENSLQPRQSHRPSIFDLHSSGWHAHNNNTAVIHRNIFCQQQRALLSATTEVKACRTCTPTHTLAKGARMGIANDIMHQDLTCAILIRDAAPRSSSSASTTPSTTLTERKICGICGA